MKGCDVFDPVTVNGLLTIIIDREYSRSILFSEPYDNYYYSSEVDARRLQNDTEKTKTAFFLKLSHKMVHIKIVVCILFGGDLGGHLGLATNFLKTIRWP